MEVLYSSTRYRYDISCSSGSLDSRGTQNKRYDTNIAFIWATKARKMEQGVPWVGGQIFSRVCTVYTYQVAVNKSQSTDYRTMAPGCLFHISIGKATAFGYDFPDSHIALLVLLVLLHR